MLRAVIFLIALLRAVAQDTGLRFVDNAAALLEAFASSAMHVVVTEHLDLTDVRSTDATNLQLASVSVPASLLSITGRCEDAAPAAGDVQHSGAQCVISSNGTTLVIAEPDSRILFDSLVFTGSSSSGVFMPLVSANAVPGSVTMFVNVAFEGRAGDSVSGFTGDEVRAFFADTAFRNLRAPAGAAVAVTSATVDSTASAVFDRCTIEDCDSTELSDSAERQDYEIFEAPASGAVSVGQQRDDGVAYAVFVNSSFARNVGPNVAKRGPGTVYADVPLRIDSDDEDYEGSALNMATDVEELTPFVDNALITSDSPEFITAVAARDAALAMATPPRTEAQLRGNDSDISSAELAAIVIACTMAVLFLVAAAVCVVRRRAHGVLSSESSLISSVGVKKGSKEDKQEPESHSRSTEGVPFVASVGASLNAGTASGLASGTLHSSVSGVGAARSGSASYLAPHEPWVNIDREVLLAELDRMHASGERLVKSFTLQSDLFRRVGGQGVVQFGRRCFGSEEEVAVKFFLNEAALERELHVYRLHLDGVLLPLLDSSGPRSCERTLSGFRLPPFIVVERGEALNEWVSRMAPDLPAAIFVLLHIAQKLQRLHAAGIVHRDLKPSNIVWQPSANGWTLVDFGSAAESGSKAPASHTARYAAPEAIQAVTSGQTSALVTEALDVWALGIIAVELLTRRRVFPHDMPVSSVKEQLTGAAPLPWEDPATAEPLCVALKGLRRSVLLCLARNASDRPSIAELHGKWTNLFEVETGRTCESFVFGTTSSEAIVPVLAP